jgi:hypothetical protein
MFVYQVYVHMYGFLKYYVLYLFICAVCCMHGCLSSIKYICGYVWLDDFKLLCVFFLYVLYVVCMLFHVCVVQYIVEFKVI